MVCLAALLCACATPSAPPPVVESRPAAPVPVLPPKAESVPAPMPPAATDPPAQPAAPVPHIALILPTQSGPLGSVADSVQQGFMAAAAAEGKNSPVVRVYPTANENSALPDAIRTALSQGARLIVGGLTRDGATALARQSLQQTDLPILALNTPDASVSARFHYISLGLDQEARSIAQLAWAEGAKLATVIHGTGGLARRIQEAFEKEWQQLGGKVVLQIAATGDLNAAQAIRPKLEDLRNDMVFIATDVDTTRIIRPYVPIWMTPYATSLSVDARAEPVANVDLDGVRYLEMPWFVQPDHPAVMIYPRPPAGTPIEQERLYALGIDAWRLAVMQSRDGQQVPPDGVTGKLKLDASGHVLRKLTPSEVRDGRSAPYGKVD